MPFSGQLEKIRLISEVFWASLSSPESGEDKEQRLTLTAGGQVWLSRYCYLPEGDGDKKGLKEKSRFSVSKEAAGELLETISRFFGAETGQDAEEDFEAATGTWDLFLTNTEGETFSETGFFYGRPWDDYGNLSERIRNCLGLSDLFLFDGNPDVIEKLHVDYYRKTNNAEYTESLSMNRTTETLERVRTLSPDCKMTYTYTLKDGVSAILNVLPADLFSYIEGNPSDVAENPADIRTYTITLHTRKGVERVIKGTFDKYGLPADWPDFIEFLLAYLASFGLGELFDKSIYSRPKRRASELIFCKVIFEENGRSYCYLADTDDYFAGNLVVVPAGADNHKAVVKIISVEYYLPEDAPYPVGKTKHILGKYTGEEA